MLGTVQLYLLKANCGGWKIFEIAFSVNFSLQHLIITQCLDTLSLVWRVFHGIIISDCMHLILMAGNASSGDVLNNYSNYKYSKQFWHVHQPQGRFLSSGEELLGVGLSVCRKF